MDYVTCALTTYGGWGDEFLKRHVLPAYRARLKEEKEAGGSGWESRRWLDTLYEDMSITIARAKYGGIAPSTTAPPVLV